jgi:hypothetical protein
MSLLSKRVYLIILHFCIARKWVKIKDAAERKWAKIKDAACERMTVTKSSVTLHHAIPGLPDARGSLFEEDSEIEG